MSGSAAGWPALALFLAWVLVQRGIELVVSARHQAVSRTCGGREYGRGHFKGFVALHALYPIALGAEVLVLGAHPPAFWPVFFVPWLLAQVLRGWAIAALGTSWNVRVWVTPGMRLVRRGPYRFMRHPNYLAVIVELLAAPLMFGAWRTALVVSVLNAALLRVRIPVEERALREAAAPDPGPPSDDEFRLRGLRRGALGGDSFEDA
jgi:methyltransferase